MVTYKNGTRYEYTERYDELLNQPYDYEKCGLMERIASQRINTTNNQITKFVCGVFEKTMVFLLKYTDILANFKNPHYRNR